MVVYICKLNNKTAEEEVTATYKDGFWTGDKITIEYVRDLMRKNRLHPEDLPKHIRGSYMWAALG